MTGETSWFVEHWPTIRIVTAIIGIGGGGGGLGFIIWRTGRISMKFENIVTDVGLLKTDIKKVLGWESTIINTERLFSDAAIASILGSVTESKSPVTLNEKGIKILEDSGIRESVEARKDEILEYVKSKDYSNPYRVQESIKKYILSWENDDTIAKLETGAYETGFDLITVLLVGAIHIRDVILKELEMDIKDIDKHHDPNLSDFDPRKKPKENDTQSD